ncbi:hypothetical protein ACKKBG_A00445 [Auxenochlorella protothecoides x Auxenochlorella symbiontica]
MKIVSVLEKAATFAPRLASSRRSHTRTVMSAGKIVHWQSKNCPYAQRSWITLLEKNLSFDIKEVDLENKSDEFKAKYASLHPGPDAPAKVPILDDADGTALFESLVVAYYLNDKYPEPALLPSEAAAKAKISLFIELFPPSIFSNAFSLVKAETRAQVAERLPALVQGLKTANALLTSLGSSEGGDYFAGAQYTLADIATSPLYHRAVHLLKGHRDIDIPAILQEHKLDRLAAWSKAVLERPSFQETAPDAEVVIKSMAKFVNPLSD